MENTTQNTEIKISGNDWDCGFERFAYFACENVGFMLNFKKGNDASNNFSTETNLRIPCSKENSYAKVEVKNLPEILGSLGITGLAKARILEEIPRFIARHDECKGGGMFHKIYYHGHFMATEEIKISFGSWDHL